MHRSYHQPRGGAETSPPPRGALELDDSGEPSACERRVN